MKVTMKSNEKEKDTNLDDEFKKEVMKRFDNIEKEISGIKRYIEFLEKKNGWNEK